MHFVLQREGRTSRREVYRNADTQLCVWESEDAAEAHAAKVTYGRQKWVIRTARTEDYKPLRKGWPDYKPTYVVMDYRNEEKVKRMKKKTTSTGCLVELFEDYEQRRVAIASKAATEEEFISELSQAMASGTSANLEVRLRDMLPLIVDICCKYRGYKAETVQERRELVAGDLEMPRT